VYLSCFYCNTSGEKHGLALTSEGGKTALVRLYAKSAFERDDWVRAFQTLREEIEAKRQEHFGKGSPPYCFP